MPPGRIGSSSTARTTCRRGGSNSTGARKPHVVRGALAGELDGITQLTCTAEADLKRWWSGVDGAGEDLPALTATADHPLGEAILSIEGTPAKDGSWTVDVATAVEGRLWARPLVAAADDRLRAGSAVKGAHDSHDVQSKLARGITGHHRQSHALGLAVSANLCGRSWWFGVQAGVVAERMQPDPMRGLPRSRSLVTLLSN